MTGKYHEKKYAINMTTLTFSTSKYNFPKSVISTTLSKQICTSLKLLGNSNSQEILQMC